MKGIQFLVDADGTSLKPSKILVPHSGAEDFVFPMHLSGENEIT
jgi:hypothetical protein